MIHRSKVPPPEAIRLGPESVIWVTSLVPEPDLSSPVFGENIAERVQDHWRNNAVKVFSSTRPYTKERAETEAVLTWTEKTVITSEITILKMTPRQQMLIYQLRTRCQEFCAGVKW